MGFTKYLVTGLTAACFFAAALQTAEASGFLGTNAFQQGNYADAIKHLEPAARAGDPEAMYTLGRMYAAGQGVGKDEKKATEFFAMAAELGDPRAQQRLGSALMLGEGIEQEMIEALKWFIIAARAGNKDATAYAGRVSRFMTGAQRREARIKAMDWQKAHSEKTKKN